MDDKQEIIYRQMIKKQQEEIEEKDAFIEELVKKANLYDLYAENSIHAEQYIEAIKEIQQLKEKLDNELKEVQKFKAEFIQKIHEIL